MTAQGTITIVRFDPAICVHDNGTNICDKGHRLTTTGICVSQSVGTYNSTGYQPSYPLCETDYESSTGSTFHQDNIETQIYGSSVLLSLGGILASFSSLLSSEGASGTTWFIIRSITKTPFDVSFFVWENYIVDSFSTVQDTPGSSGTSILLQQDSGWIIHDEGVSSTFFQADIFATYSMLMPAFLFPKFDTELKISKFDSVFSRYNEFLSDVKSNTTNPSLDEFGISFDNPVEICSGDLSPPFVDSITPASGTSLRPVSEVISFNIKDSLGGVDLSSLQVTISGNITTQTGGPNIVIDGVEQVPEVNITGSPSDYALLYNPPLDWSPNEIVTVTISGSDLLPTISGNPFTCTDGTTNKFLAIYSFKVKNQEEFAASITALADTSAPYLDNIFPVPFLGNSSAFSDISFDIKDDLSGVDISTVTVYINGTPVILNGVSKDTASSISGDKNDYQFTYSNSSGFSFGSRVLVRVVADDLYDASPNTLDYSYYYDVINDSSLVIDNFSPGIGISFDPDKIDISVDIYDSIYDTKDSALYLKINGATVVPTLTPIYGNRYLTTTISGLTAISGTFLNDSSLHNVTITGTSIVGDAFYGGGLVVGSGYSGQIGSFPQPFDLTSSASLIAADFFEGSVTSGTVDSSLVLGVNWDGNFVDATISGVEVSSFYSTNSASYGTVISGSIGENLTYHPPNDFDYGEPISIIVHGENLNSLSKVIKEKLYQLFHGYNVKVFDRSFIHGQRVNVFGIALNDVDFSNELNFGYYFSVIEQQYKNLGASIVGIAPYENLVASITPQAPVHRYGQTSTIELTVSDREGNVFGPYTFTYTIESKPS